MIDIFHTELKFYDMGTELKENKKRIPWNKGLKASEDPRVAKNISNSRKTLREKYGVTNAFRIPDVVDKREEDKEYIYEKVAQTKQSRYGDRKYNNCEKGMETKQSRYGDRNYNNPTKNRETRMERNSGTYWSNEQRQVIGRARIQNNSQEKANETIIERYGDMASYYDMIAKKRYDTMSKNGTLCVKDSSAEKEYYEELLKKYSPEDIKRQYMDKDRYPFRCDFYIVPEDKFVEIHGFFTHGTHPYDRNNEEDVRIADKLMELGTPWSKAILYTWTDLDVRKLETAKKNKLNFEAIYWYEK